MKCLILGDSISEGIGSKSINYIDYLKEMDFKKDIEFINLAKAGSTISYAVDRLQDIASLKPDYCIIMYGSVDAQIRPNRKSDRWHINTMIPKRYKMGGMLAPRAFYSKKWYRWLPDRADNLFRLILRNLVLLTQGTIQLETLDVFECHYNVIVNKLLEINCKCILLSTVFIDDKYFLNSSKEYVKYNKCVEEIANTHKCIYVDLYTGFKRSVINCGWKSLFAADHFHPNAAGYCFIAKQIYPYLNIIEKRDR